MQSNEYELIVSQQKNPLWKVALSGIFFGFALLAFSRIALMEHFSHLEPEESQYFNKQVFAIIFYLAGGIYFSVRLTILIDLDKEKLVSRYFLGFFSIDSTMQIPDLSHVSVFKNRDEYYMINLYYRTTKHYNMCYTEDRQKALEFAKMVSQKLNIEMRDAS